MILTDLEKLKEDEFKTSTGVDDLIEILFLLFKLYSPMLGDFYNDTFGEFKKRFGPERLKSYITYYTLDGKLIGFVSAGGNGNSVVSGITIVTVPNVSGYGMAMVKYSKQVKSIPGFRWGAVESNYPSCNLLYKLGGVIYSKSRIYNLQNNGSMTESVVGIDGVCLVDNATVLKENFPISKSDYESLRKATEMYIEREVKPLYEKWLKNEYSKRGKIVDKINNILTKRNLM